MLVYVWFEFAELCMCVVMLFLVYVLFVLYRFTVCTRSLLLLAPARLPEVQALLAVEVECGGRQAALLDLGGI